MRDFHLTNLWVFNHQSLICLWRGRGVIQLKLMTMLTWCAPTFFGLGFTPKASIGC